MDSLDSLRTALRALSPLLRRRGTSPFVGQGLRAAVRKLDDALAATDEGTRAATLERAIGDLRACADFIRTADRPADREQLDGVLAALAALEPSAPAAIAYPPTVPLPMMLAPPPPVTTPEPPSPSPLVEFLQPRAVPIGWPDTPEATAPPPATETKETPPHPPEPSLLPDPIVREVGEEHLDEATFLWGDWESSLRSVRYSLDEVADGPEERLLAHLDGLVVGGDALAEELLLPALTGDDPERTRVATWALLASEGIDHLDTVLGALASAEPALASSMARAFGLSRHPAVAPRFRALFENAEPALRGIILDVLAAVDLDGAARLLPAALASSENSVMATGLRILRRLPTAEATRYRQWADNGLAHGDDGVRDEAMATAFVLGSRAVSDACRQAAGGVASSRMPFAVLALSPRPEDRRALVDGLRRPAIQRHALWALGFVGDLAAADTAANMLAAGKIGPVAAEVLATITGLEIDGPFRRAGVTAGPDDDDLPLDAPPPVVVPEDFLPPPNVPAVLAWWNENRPRFRPDRRYILGDEREPGTLQLALARVPMWRREGLALELSAATRRPVPCDLRGWTRDQKRAFRSG